MHAAGTLRAFLCARERAWRFVEMEGGLHMTARKTARIKPILQVICILLLLALLFSTLFFEVRRTARTDRERAVSRSVTEKLPATGYVFRDEQVIRSGNTGAVAYLSAEGAAVGAGEELATVYPDSTNEGARELGAAMTAELELLRDLQNADPVWQAEYLSSYAALMSSLSVGGFLSAESAKGGVEHALDVRAAAGADHSARIAELEAAFAALVGPSAAGAETLDASVDGYFYRTADGYEEMFSTDRVESMTAAGLLALLDTPPNIALSVGKVVTASAWYLALPVEAAQTERFSVDMTYPVLFTRSGVSMELRLSRIAPADDNGMALLVFCADTGELLPDICRKQEVSVSLAPVTGISVPMSALREENGEYFVYVDDGGRAARRRLSVLLMRDGYCLSAPAAGEGFLGVGEEILATSRRIYEGKTLS